MALVLGPVARTDVQHHCYWLRTLKKAARSLPRNREAEWAGQNAIGAQRFPRDG